MPKLWSDTEIVFLHEIQQLMEKGTWSVKLLRVMPLCEYMKMNKITSKDDTYLKWCHKLP